ncbi:uncharacterized protein P174DRAFT_395145 [Aspergillus novofumigatus IBT 16806]|uniref:Uncharacterized protein n=1 Tax=Aspergillus novofumigatus (strain IBT 16806) TaxID=1392255 RepID=A0A2I1C0M7_ASPN1|nr:uncharacterized protein P174DRAFT_395145 [Aspergillus novofumigatus IBT 16806]PKX91200.1 hypothetical protein P174DRAFT_395145 [Aspergillus novofumigatus IBT 16806]
MDSIIEEWCRSAGFTDAQQQAIAEARQRFHAANGPTMEHITANGSTTKYIISRIATAVALTFTDSDAMVERWPSHIRELINRFSRYPAQPDRKFETWARPRDQEQRKQAISVWTSLLAFLVVNWTSYGADGALESMGLNLSWSVKDNIDAIRYYAKEGKSLKTEVLDDQPRWTVAGLQDTTSFSQKLEAIDHYARVLVLEDAIYRGDLSPAQKEDLQNSLNQVSISWIDQDAERPAVDLRQTLLDSVSHKWRTYTEYMRPIFAEWLTGQSTGPMSTVILFLHGKLETPSYNKVYKVKMQIEEYFSIDPMMAACYPDEVGTTATIEEANKEARRCIRDDFGPKKAALNWDEVYDERGMIRIRAIYRDETNDARAVAWVEEADILTEDM